MQQDRIFALETKPVLALAMMSGGAPIAGAGAAGSFTTKWTEL